MFDSNPEILKAAIGIIAFTITSFLIVHGNSRDEKLRSGSEKSSSSALSLVHESTKARPENENEEENLEREMSRKRKQSGTSIVSTTRSRSISSSKKRNSWRMSNVFKSIGGFFNNEDDLSHNNKRSRKRSGGLKKVELFHPYKKQEVPSSIKKRLNIANEIVSSERKYVEFLGTLEEIIYQPLFKQGQSILSKKGINSLFSNFQDILSINKEILRQLEERLISDSKDCSANLSIDIQKWSPSNGKLGDIFLNLSPFLKMYSVYVRNFNFAIQFLAQEKQNNEAFKRFIDTQELKLFEKCKLPFASFLIMPVQRIPRYRLLLADLLKNTHKDHPDHEYIEKALEKIESVADFVNEQIRSFENSLQILSIQNKLINFKDIDGEKILLKPGRTLIKQGRMSRVGPKDHQNIAVFLFNDILLITRPARYNPLVAMEIFKHRHRASSGINQETKQNGSEDLYYFSLCIATKGIRITNVNINKIANDKATMSIPHSFIINSSERSFQIFCTSEIEKTEWMEKITESCRQLSAIQLSSLSEPFKSFTSTYSSKVENEIPDVSVNNDTDDFKAPLWLPDNCAASCMVCEKPFTLFNRRHHCRRCGSIICKLCSTQKIYLPENTFTEKAFRACDPCYFELYKKSSKENSYKKKSNMDRYQLKNSFSITASEIRPYSLTCSALDQSCSSIAPAWSSTGAINNSLTRDLRSFLNGEGLTQKARGKSFRHDFVAEKCELCHVKLGYFTWSIQCSECARIVCKYCGSKTRNIENSTKKDSNIKKICYLCFYDIKPENVEFVRVGETLKIK